MRKDMKLSVWFASASTIVLLTTLVFGTTRNNEFYSSRLSALDEPYLLEEDFTSPSYNDGVLHVSSGEAYIDMVCSGASLSGQSLVLDAESTAVAPVKGGVKLNITFTGDLNIAIAVKEGTFSSSEALVSGSNYTFLYNANYLKLFAGASGAVVTNIKYYYVCEIAEQVISNSFNAVAQKDGTSQAKTAQSYNFWEENSGVPYTVSTTQSKYSVSFTMETTVDLIDDGGVNVTGLGYGSSDEIQLNVPLLFYTGSTQSYFVNIRIYKWSTSWVFLSRYNSGTNISGGSELTSKYTNDATARGIVSKLSRGGVKFILDFNGASVSTYYQINGSPIFLKTVTDLAVYNGNDNGNQQLRYADARIESNATDTTLGLKATNFQVAYGYAGGSGTLAKAI